MANIPPDDIIAKRVFGRKLGRPLNASRQSALERTLPDVQIEARHLTENGDIAPVTLFDARFDECWLEIGFGAGEHLSGLMDMHPQNAYIGAEPFINGMSAFLKDIEDMPKERIRVHMDDAMMVGNSLTDNSLDGIYILNPDPWHKKRHHKRRIVSHDNLDTFARILKPRGQLVMSTDVPDLANWMVTHAAQHQDFEWQADRADDWRTPPKDWIHTAYEGKRAKNGEEMVYLFFERK